MRPGIQQQKLLRQYLRDNLKYRETCMEFYDHILTALEVVSENISFEDAINNIIRKDFGGIEGMAVIEIRYQAATKTEMKKKYLSYVIQYLKFPLLGISTMLAFFFYCIAIQPWFNFIVFFEVLLVMRIMPSAFKWIRYFKLGYVFRDTKASAKDNVYVRLNYIHGLILVFLLLASPSLHNTTPIAWFRNANPIYISLILFLYALHTLTCYKVYKNEFAAIVINRFNLL